MKKIIISILVMCFVFAGTLNTAKAAEYETKTFSYIFSCFEDYYSEGSNIIVLQTDDDCYDFKNKKPYNKIIMDTIAEDGTKSRKEFVCKNKKTYAFKLENGTLYTTVSRGSNKIIIQARNKKGKVKQSYTITLNKKTSRKIKYISIRDFVIKGNKMYYVLNVTNKKDKTYTYLKAYSLKKKKEISSKKLKNTNGRYKFNDGKLYYYNFETTIEAYSLTGKKTASYKLPDGETTIIGHVIGPGNGPEYEYSFKAVDYNGNYIYYLNRNGVYRCDTKGNGTFELIYDGSNDVVFNPEPDQEKMVEFFEVFDNGKFLIVVDNYEHSGTRGFVYEKRNS